MEIANIKQNLLSAALVLAAGFTGLNAETASASNNLFFKMQPSAAAKACLPNATGNVTVTSLGPVENMHVVVKGLPPKTDFDFFIIQVPEKPFGLSWYQGDIETDDNGVGVADFTGRFNIETFIVAPGSDVSPHVHSTDAATNPATAPVHTFHLGLWFNSPVDANNAGCSNVATPFNGDHSAGVQVLNTAQFPKDKGPLSKLKP